MAVNIQGKGSGGVTQVFLQCLDIITALDRHDRISVAQIVKTCGRHTQLFNDAFEAIIHSAIGEKPAGLIGKDQVVFCPENAGLHTHIILLPILLKEQLNHSRGQG